MERHKVEEILADALQADEATRVNAEKSIKRMMQQSYVEYLMLFSELMLDESAPLAIRRIAAIVLKNSFHSKDFEMQRDLQTSWLNCPEDVRSAFAARMEEGLSLRDIPIRGSVAKILGSVIRIDCHCDKPNSYFERLNARSLQPGYECGALMALAVACDQLYDETDYSFARAEPVIFEIATRYIVEGATADRAVVVRSLDCLMSTLDIFENVMEQADARGRVLFSVSRYVGVSDEEVAHRAVEVINKLVNVFSDLMIEHLPFVSQLYLEILGGRSDVASLESFEYWMILCELGFKQHLLQGLPVLLQRLFPKLMKEDMEDTDWTEHKATALLLATLSDALEGAVVGQEVAQSFIRQRLESSAPEEWAIGAVAFGSVCHPVAAEFTYEMLGHLVLRLSNPTSENEPPVVPIGSPISDNEVLFALAKVIEKDLRCSLNFLPTIIERCSALVPGTSESSINAIWVLDALARAVRDNTYGEINGLLSMHYTNLITLLTNKFNAIHPEQFEVRNALSTVLAELIPLCPNDKIQLLYNLTEWLAARISETVGVLGQSPRDMILILESIISAYLVLLSVALCFINAFEPAPITDLLIKVLQTPANKSHGEVYFILVKLVAHFRSHLSQFVPFILRDAQSNDTFVAKAALNMLSCATVTLEEDFIPFTEDTIPVLIAVIGANTLDLDYKPRVIEILGEIALAVGKGFEPYLELATGLLNYIAMYRRTGELDCVDKIRSAIITTFDYIIMSVGSSAALSAKIDGILDIFERIMLNDIHHAYCNESVNLLNDVNQHFYNKLRSHPWVGPYLASVLPHLSSEYAVLARALQ
ncbi:importin subunit beta-1 [Pancytospora philotis]|nr:importin subunit beta-1 [Pancytospora philotis]